MPLSKEFFAMLYQLQGNAENLNHIADDDPRLKKLRKLLPGAKGNNERKVPKSMGDVVKIIYRGEYFYNHEDVDWEVIKAHRKAKNLTQIEIGKLARMNGSAYGQYEKGRKRISKKRLIDVCKVLNLEIEEHRMTEQEKGKRIPVVNNELIRETRREKKITQPAIGELIGLKVAAYSNREVGSIRWTEEELKVVCERLGLKMEDVMV